MDDKQPDILFRSPAHYPLELVDGNVVFVSMNPDTYRRSVFLDKRRIVAASRSAWAAPLAGLQVEYDKLGCNAPRVDFIFHMAHCGSTLLSRALEAISGRLVLREPFALRQLAVSRDLEYLPLLLALLARAPDESAPTLVKANVPVNFVMRDVLAANAPSRAVFLYASLKDYLPAVLKSEQHRRWVCNVTQELATGVRSIEAFSDVRIESLSAPQAAAMLWYAQMQQLDSLPAGRVTCLDSARLLDEPVAALHDCCECLDCDATRVDEVVNSELFLRHAKSPHVTFDAATWRDEKAELRRSLSEDIREGIDWLRALTGIDEFD